MLLDGFMLCHNTLPLKDCLVTVSGFPLVTSFLYEFKKKTKNSRRTPKLYVKTAFLKTRLGARYSSIE